MFHYTNNGYSEIPPMSDSKKLTINTSFGGGSFYPSMASASPSGTLFQASPIRRRNNYNSGDMGPMFSGTKQLIPVWTADKSKQVTFGIQAKIDKGFFLSENDWTCYRRNYFQVSGTFNYSTNGILPTPLDGHDKSQDIDCYVELQGSLYQVKHFKMNVSAHVAATEKIIELVQHTSKRDKGPQMTPQPRLIKAGGQLMQSQLHQLMSSQSASSYNGNTVVTFERLQFKSATANNGKRRAAQQYYVLSLDLYAEVEDFDGELKLFKIATASSSPLVVRGRSPGHYFDSERLASPYGLLAAATIADPNNFMTPQSAGLQAQINHSFFNNAMDNSARQIMVPMTAYSTGLTSNMMFSPTANFKPTVSQEFFAANTASAGIMSSARSEKSSVGFMPSATFSDRSPLYHEVSYGADTAVQQPQETFLTEPLSSELFQQYEL